MEPVYVTLIKLGKLDYYQTNIVNLRNSSNNIDLPLDVILYDELWRNVETVVGDKHAAKKREEIIT